MTYTMPFIRYRLVSQNRNGLLTIQIIEQNHYATYSAQQILKNNLLLEGFHPKEVAQISYIAAMEAEYQLSKPRATQ